MGQLDRAETPQRGLSPQPVKVRKGELPIEVHDIVPDVEDQAVVIATVLLVPESPPNHLEVQVGAVDWTSDDDGAGLRRVEAFPEYGVVHECLHLPSPEGFDYAAAGGWVSLSCCD